MGLLRLWLAMAVAIEHSGRGFLGLPLQGDLAVSAFYAISGFYIQFIISESYSGQPHWIANFYKSRALRIYPLYYFFLILSLPWALQKDLLWQALAPGNVWTVLFTVGENLLIFGQDIARFLKVEDGALALSLPRASPDLPLPASHLALLGVGQSWSLAVELWFYLIAPFLLAKRTRTLIAVALCSLALRVLIEYAWGDGQWSRWWNHFFPSEVAIFLAGSLGYRFYARYRPKEVWGWVFLALIFLYSITYQRFAPHAVAASYFGAIILIAVAIPFVFSASRKSRVDRFIGELSYPVYLGHFFFVQLLTLTAMDPRWYGPIVVTGSILLAIPLVLLLDEPLARYRHSRFTRERHVAA